MLNDVLGVDEMTLLETVSNILKDENITKKCYDIKEDYKYILLNNEIKMSNYIDVMVAYYVVTTSNGPYTIDDFSTNYLNDTKQIEDVFNELFSILL